MNVSQVRWAGCCQAHVGQPASHLVAEICPSYKCITYDITDRVGRSLFVISVSLMGLFRQWATRVIHMTLTVNPCCKPTTKRTNLCVQD